MNAELSVQLAQLLRQRSTAALGTLREGAPFVSMVPYAIAPDGSGFVVHVSRLAAHTRDMLADARVSLLVAEAEGAGKSPLGLMRVSVQGLARRVSVAHALHALPDHACPRRAGDVGPDDDVLLSRLGWGVVAAPDALPR